MENEFEIIKHTSDTGIIAWGNDLKELVNNLVRGFNSIYFDEIPDKQNLDWQKKVINIKFDDNNLENLFVDFINEIIFYVETQNSVVLSTENLRIEDNIACFQLKTAGINERFQIGLPIKAATYHQLKFKDKPCFYLKIILDV